MRANDRQRDRASCVKSAGGAIYSVSDDDDDGDEPEPLRIANGEAASAIDVTMRYFEQSELAITEDVQHLSFIKRRVDYMRVYINRLPPQYR